MVRARARGGRCSAAVAWGSWGIREIGRCRPGRRFRLDYALFTLHILLGYRAAGHPNRTPLPSSRSPRFGLRPGSARAWTAPGSGRIGPRCVPDRTSVRAPIVPSPSQVRAGPTPTACRGSCRGSLPGLASGPEPVFSVQPRPSLPGPQLPSCDGDADAMALRNLRVHRQSPGWLRAGGPRSADLREGLADATGDALSCSGYGEIS